MNILRRNFASNITSTGFTIRGTLLGTKATNIDASWVAVSN